MQWISFMDEVILLRPEATHRSTRRDLVALPDHVKAIPLHDGSGSPWRRKASTQRVARQILTKDHILYVRMPSYEGYWCAQVAWEKGIPVMAELHGDWESVILCEDKRGLVRTLTRRFRATSARKAVQTMCDRAFCVVAIGPKLAEQYVPSTTPTLITTNHLLEEHDYRERTVFALHDPPRILFVGGLVRLKGLHILFAALSKLRQRGNDFEMVLIGPGPQQSELTAYAKSHGFGDKVVFLGHVPHGEALFEQYRQADMFVLPSMTEGVPRVVHEAMAMGCPVVATDVGSVAWQLRDGAGIIVRPNDVDGLADAMASVLDDSDLRKRLSVAAYQRSLEHTLERQQQGIEEFTKRHISLLGR